MSKTPMMRERLQAIPTEELPKSDRHLLSRQVLTALMMIAVMAAVIGLTTRHLVMGGCGVVGTAILFAVLYRLPTADAPEDGGRE